MMSVKDVQEMLGIPLLGAIPEDPQVRMSLHGKGGRVWVMNGMYALKVSTCLRRAAM